MQSLLALINVSSSFSITFQASVWNIIPAKWTLHHHLAHHIDAISYNDLFKADGILDAVQGLHLLFVLAPGTPKNLSIVLKEE